MIDVRRLFVPLAAIVALAAVLAALQASGLAFWQGLFVNVGLFIILTVSLNLSNGFTGVFSLGHIGFMALGALEVLLTALPGIGDILPPGLVGPGVQSALRQWLPSSLSGYRDAFVFVALILMLLFRPNGILGQRDHAEIS